jgi:hypothetical protein
MNRVITTAESNSCSPEAINQTTTGAPIMPRAHVTSKAQQSTVATASTKACVATSPSLARVAASNGTKACEKAPSANNRRSRFGIRNATLKASIHAPAPNSEACNTWLTRPVTREPSVSSETVDAARSRFMRWGKMGLAGRPNSAGRWSGRIIGSGCSPAFGQGVAPWSLDAPLLYSRSLVRHVCVALPSCGVTQPIE